MFEIDLTHAVEVRIQKFLQAVHWEVWLVFQCEDIVYPGPLNRLYR